MKKLLTLAAAILMAACAVSGPYEAAETVEQKVYALQKTYNVMLGTARDIVVDTTLPADVRLAVQKAEAETTPVFDKLDTDFTALLAEMEKFLNGASSAEKLDALTSLLEMTMLDATEALDDLTTAIASGE